MGLFSSHDIKIEIPKYIYSPGEVLSGKIITSISEPVEATSLSVKFYGEMIEKRRNISTIDGNSNVTEMEHRTLFGEQSVILSGDGVYDSLEYDFSLMIPLDIYPEIPLRGDIQIPGLPSWANVGIDLLTQAANIGGLIGGVGYRFFLEARLDIPWAIDVTKKIEITVSRIPPTAGSI